MDWFLYYFGFFYIGFGTAYILYTDAIRNYLKPILKGIDRRPLSTIPIIFGILLIFSAPSSMHSWFIRALGIAGIIKGIFSAIVPKTHYEILIDWYFEKASDQVSRLFGIIAIILGTIILSWIK